MYHTHMKFIVFLLLLVLCSKGIYCSSVACGSTPRTITISLYTYVYNISYFQQTLVDQWKSLCPNISLKFIPWDCYNNSEPFPTADVFVFDTVYLQFFVRNNILLDLTNLLPVGVLDEFYPYAADAGLLGDSIYGLPQLGCTYSLFSHSNDTTLHNAKSIDELVQISQHSKDQIVRLGCSGNADCAQSYITLLQLKSKSYNSSLQIPTTLDPEIISQLQQASCVSNQEPFSYFFDGTYRAMVAYSEVISQATPLQRSKINLDIFPYSSSPSFVPFYVDLVSINSHIHPSLLSPSLLLIQLLTSHEYLLATIQHGDQFLIPSRPSVMSRLSNNANSNTSNENTRIYSQIEKISSTNLARPFLLNLETKGEYLEFGKYVLEQTRCPTK